MRYKTGSGLPRQDIQAAISLAAMSFVPLADQLFIPTRVEGDRGNMGVIPVSAFMNDPGDISRSRKSGSKRSDWQLEDRSYAIKTYSHEEAVTDADAARVGGLFNAQKFAAQRGRLIVLRKQEIRAQAAAHSTATFTGSTNTLAVATPWSSSASADPIGNFNRARTEIRGKCGFSTISAQISFAGWQDLSLCDQIRQTLKYTDKVEGLIPLSGLASALGLKRLLCPGDGNLVNSAKEGQTETLAEIWPSANCLVFAEPTADDLQDPAMPCLGRMWYWEGDGGQLEVDEYPEPQTEAVVTRVKQAVQEDLISSRFGYLLTGVH